MERLIVFWVLVVLLGTCPYVTQQAVSAEGYDLTALSSLARKAPSASFKAEKDSVSKCPEYTTCIPRFKCEESDIYRSATDKVFCGDHPYADYVCCKSKGRPEEGAKKQAEGERPSRAQPEHLAADEARSAYTSQNPFFRRYAPYQTRYPRDYDDDYYGSGCNCGHGSSHGGYGYGGLPRSRPLYHGRKLPFATYRPWSYFQAEPYGLGHFPHAYGYWNRFGRTHAAFGHGPRYGYNGGYPYFRSGKRRGSSYGRRHGKTY